MKTGYRLISYILWKFINIFVQHSLKKNWAINSMGLFELGESLQGIIGELSKQKGLIAWFLILWGATFFFSAISDFVWLAEGRTSGIDLAIDVLWDLADLGIAAILIMLGLKMRENV